MDYSQNSLIIYKNLYFSEGETTPEQVHNRVAKNISNSEQQYLDFKYILDNKIFRPNTPCLINAGINYKNNHNNNLCACFIFGLEDNMLSIIDMWKTASLIYSSGGGMGANIGRLREKGSHLSKGGCSSGPISFMKVIQSISDTVKSGGKSRRAANLMSMKYNHPDILEFIDCKSKTILSAMNISVLVDDEFFRKLENKEDIDLISPNDNIKICSINSLELWNKICEHAWKTGDPGLLFYNQTNKKNPFPSIGDITANNPCAEVALPDFTACNLGSINLNSILTDTNIIDWVKFGRYISIATTFLNNVIDKTSFPHIMFENNMKKLRPIGLGIMGFADILFKMKIGYDTQEAIDLFEEICKFLTTISYKTSIGLNGPKVKIPKEDAEHFYNLLLEYGLNNDDIDIIKQYGISNTQVSCIAPTGSISITCDCSYAFEPCFALVWEKPLVDRNEILYFINPIFEKEIPIIEEESGKTRDEILKDIKQNHGSIQNISYINQSLKNIYKVAHDISAETKIKMQSAGQKYITMAISSTCNLPTLSTKEDIANIYKLAYKSNLKGITVYRDGCLEFQPVQFGESADKKKNNKSNCEPSIRPMVRNGKTIELSTPHGKLYLTGNIDENNNLIEVFIKLGKQGTLTSALLNSLGRVISKGLQYNVPPDIFIDTLLDTQGDAFWVKLGPTDDNATNVSSVIDAVARLLDKYFLDNILTNNLEISNDLEECPSCHKKTLSRTIGCRGGTCISCGYSKCS